MAVKPRHPRPDLTAEPAGIEALELLRRLETPDARFGRAGGPDNEPARLGQGASLAFAACDVAEHTVGRDGAPDRVALNILGLLGPSGPMPLHLTRWVIERLSNRWFAGQAEGATSDTAFLDFVNLLQHRLMALYWRAWADARPEIEFAHGKTGRIPALLGTLAGTGLPGSQGGEDRETAKKRHATSLALAAYGPERILGYLADVAGAPVRLLEFVGVWTEVPGELQTRLGRAHSQLGQSAVAGARVYERQATVELRVGPMPMEHYLAHLEDAGLRAELSHAVVFAMGHGIAFDLRLVLAATDVPDAQLGACRLGRTTWLNPVEGREADDLCIRRFPERAAA
jgi:type VI secretion system protein ImpH